MDRVVHFEIPFDSKERALKFYKETFGWETIDLPEMNYVMVHAAQTDENNMVNEKGAINGGMFPRESAVKNPVIVIGVDDVDAAVQRAIAGGGSLVMPKNPIPNGFYARVADSEGNIIGLAGKR